MTENYEFVVLRLSPDPMRGETLNAGLIVFAQDGSVDVKIGAALGKLRALDDSIDRRYLATVRQRIMELVSYEGTTEDKVARLADFGFCSRRSPGFFTSNRTSYRDHVRELEEVYVVPAGIVRNQRSRLLDELLERLRSMSLLGSEESDLNRHLAVPSLPIPLHPDLKGDLVYRNGVYRITQTVDYQVAAAAAHKKISEVCTKVMAADLARRSWGDNLRKYAVVRVPETVASIADPHLDLLHAQGFDIFHYDNGDDLARYHESAFAH